jgi:hypothetical protein
MQRWTRLVLVILILASTFGAGWALAQAQNQTPMIISGNDVGFRVDQQRTRNLGRLAGSWVVRFNGDWVEPDTSGTRALTTR